MRFRSFLLALVFVATTACSAAAQFHSRTGRAYPAVAAQAVRCTDDEARLVVAAGGEVIGTISAHALAVDATDDDVADKAARVAAKHGGTHVVLTEKGVETFYVNHPATKTTQCQHVEGEVDCETTYTPPSTSTFEKPTAKFVVLRVPQAQWGRLPEGIRPVPAT